MLGYSSALNNGGVTTPKDASVFGSNSAKIVCNNIDGYSCKDVNTVSAQDPRVPFKNSDESCDAYGSSVNLSSVPEAGISGGDSVLRFGKVPDPMDANRMAFLLRLTQGDPDTASSKRVELAQGSSSSRIIRGRDYWIATAFLTPSSWKSADAVLVGNPSASNDETMVWQIHDDGDIGDDPGNNPNVGMILFGGGSGSPENSRQKIIVRNNANAATLRSENSYRLIFDEANYPADDWQYWIFKIRLHWDASYGPYIHAWQRVGYFGDWVNVVNDTQPNQYNNVKNDYQKAGVYYYANAWTGGVTSRLMHSKGLFLFRDSDGVSLESISKFLNKI